MRSIPIFSILWGSLLVVLLGGCAPKEYNARLPKLIVLKTPKLKFADTGYLDIYGTDRIDLEIFVAGFALEKISFDRLVCVGAVCMREESFTHEYLSPAYPTTTMRDVLLGRDVFEGEGKNIISGEITQRIVRENIDILYTRTPDTTEFVDTLNRITIRLSSLEE